MNPHSKLTDCVGKPIGLLFLLFYGVGSSLCEGMNHTDVTEIRKLESRVGFSNFSHNFPVLCVCCIKVLVY